MAAASRRLKANAHPFRGFEQPPEGCLFDQVVDLSQSMGFAYERSLGFFKSMHVHDRALFVFPRGGSSMGVGVPSISPRRLNLTSADGLVVPAGLEHDDKALSTVYDTFALFPSDELLASACRAASVPVRAFASCTPFRRSPWLESLLEEYFDECVLQRRGGEGRGALLSPLIVVEVARAIAGEAPEKDRNRPASGPSSLVARALRHLEANLFSEIDLERLSRATGSSRSSLLRHFKSEVGLTPVAYVHGRRLDEGRRLLERGTVDVGEAARLVGYANAGAFSEAYRRKFGESPSRAKAD